VGHCSKNALKLPRIGSSILTIIVAAACRKRRDISSLLVNKCIPLKNRARIYCACMRPMMLYGATTKAIEKKIFSCDQRMLRHIYVNMYVKAYSKADLLLDNNLFVIAKL